MAAIFEPLQRATTTGTSSRSIGLGLYIVQQIVTAHGGTVHAHSEEGEGTTFTVTLPAEPLGATPHSPEMVPVQVLLVEDDPEIRQAEREIFESEGFEVIEAAHGAAALEALTRVGAPAVIVLDLMMPVMDGVAFLERLGAEGRTNLRQRVVVTSADIRAKQKVSHLGVRAVLPKPFSITDLRAVVEALVAERRRSGSNLH